MRRRLCLLVGVILASAMTVIASPALATTTATSCPAVAVGEDAAHDGHSCTTLSRVLWQRWRKPVIGYPGTPVIAAGRVFVMSGKPGGTASWLYALSKATGATLWGPVPLGGYGDLAYDNGRLFTNPGGDVLALDPATGRQLWSYPSYLPAAALTATGGRIYLQSDGGVYALDEATGALIWKSPAVDGSAGVVGIDDTGAYLSSGCGGRYKLNLGNGAVVWSGNDGCIGGVYGTAILWGSRMYGTDGDHVLDKATGRKAGSSFTGFPAFSGTRGYFSHFTVVTARDLSSNAIKWTVDLGEYTVGAPVTTDNGLVIVLTQPGHLIGLDATTGKRVFIRTVAPYGLVRFRLNPLSVGDGALVTPSGQAIALLR